MTKRLEGKIALVTGASRGIGQAIAVKLAADGASVLVHHRANEEGARKTCAEIETAGGKAEAFAADIATEEGVALLRQRVEAALAGRPLDIIVNNAGIGGGAGIETIDAASFDRLFDTNVKGTFLVTQALLPLVPDGGRVINITSMVALAAYPKSIAYAMTKAALNSFTVSLAADVGARGITVNAVAPGATATDFIGRILSDPALVRFYSGMAALQRLGEAGDIAPVVAFLASDEGRWVTGQVIQASGGMHL